MADLRPCHALPLRPEFVPGFEIPGLHLEQTCHQGAKTDALPQKQLGARSKHEQQEQNWTEGVPSVKILSLGSPTVVVAAVTFALEAS